MKIIHCSDLHLDSRMESNLNREQARERKRELLLTFEKMIEYAANHEVRAIIIAGDLFDTTHISKNAAIFVGNQINNHPSVDFLYLRGNHERDVFLETLDIIPDNLKIFAENWTKFSYEYLTISGVVLTPENSRHIYDSLVLAQDDVNIVVLHGQESQYEDKGNADVISIRALQNKYINYLALGHIHQYKIQKLDHRGNYCYCGCLEGRGFDECGEKGFVLLEIEEGTVSSEFIPIAQRICHEIMVDISGLHTTTEIAERIDAQIAQIDKRSLVKIILTGEIDMDTDCDIVYLRKRYESRFYFLKIYDKTKLAINYEDYRLDQSLKGEFIRTLEKADLAQTEKDAVILTGIRALSGEEI